MARAMNSGRALDSVLGRELIDEITASGRQTLIISPAFSPADLSDEAGADSKMIDRPSDYRRWDGTEAHLLEVLAESYGNLPDGAVVAIESNRISGHRRRERGWRDVFGTALHRSGFSHTTFRRGGSAGLACAERAHQRPGIDRPFVLSVIVPVFNEAGTVDTILNTLTEMELDHTEIEIIVVESNSTDGSRDIVERYRDSPRVRIVYEETPSGKGHALRTGLGVATGDFVLIQDADLEYDFVDYAKLLEPLVRFEASFVLGIRTRTHGARFGVRRFESRNLTSQIMNVGNIGFLALFNLFYGERLRDPFTMYKVFRRDCLANIALESNRFDFDWELTGKLVRLGYRPLEIPVAYHSRSFSEGKKISVLRDPLTWIRACVKYRFVRLD